MQPIGIGFVGAGWMGSAQLKLLSRRTDVRLCALLEPNRERGNALLRELNLPPDLLVTDFDQILANPLVHAVWLASPNCFHGQQSLAAMRAGKHVFCEKPSATTFEEFRAQIDLQHAHPELITYVDYILYFDAMERRLRQLVADDTFGTITQIQVNYRHPVNISGDKTWKLDHRIMGDAIGMGINHALSVMLLAMQPQARPIEVYATSQEARVRGFDADPAWSILIRFDNGASGFCFGNIDNGNGYDAYHSLYGTDGAFVFDAGQDRPQKVRYWSGRQTDGKWIFPLDSARCAREQAAHLAWPAEATTPDDGNVMNHQLGEAIDHFISHVRSGRPSPLSFTNAAVIGEVGWAARLSARLGRPVPLPVTAEAWTG